MAPPPTPKTPCPPPSEPTAAERDSAQTRQVIGLLLTGGGARAAYQVGVLQAMADLRRAAGQAQGPNPFPIITGTSAGAINAAALACGADDFEGAVAGMAAVWSQMHADQVYLTDSLSLLRSGTRWMTLLSLGWLVAKWRRLKPRSLLDNSPLQRLLEALVPLERLPALMRRGHMCALAVTASSYSTGEHLTFFQGMRALKPWSRSQRRAVRTRITHQHLLASSAIPFIFPATELAVDGQPGYFGDGSMRQSAPLAAAIHLGATRLVVIGAGRMSEPGGTPASTAPHAYPSLAQIAGHTLSNIFLDALGVDIERARRINLTLALIPAELRDTSALKPIELLVIAPSERLDGLAARHVGHLPPAMRTLLGGLGVSTQAADIKGAALASYLLFESSYTQELMALGRADALRQQAEICEFFGWHAEGSLDSRLRGNDEKNAVIQKTPSSPRRQGSICALEADR